MLLRAGGHGPPASCCRDAQLCSPAPGPREEGWKPALSSLSLAPNSWMAKAAAFFPSSSSFLSCSGEIGEGSTADTGMGEVVSVHARCWPTGSMLLIICCVLLGKVEVPAILGSSYVKWDRNTYPTGLWWGSSKVMCVKAGTRATPRKHDILGGVCLSHAHILRTTPFVALA